MYATGNARKSTFSLPGRTLSSIFGIRLKSQETGLHQWKPKNNGAVLLRETVNKCVLLRETNAFQLEKVG